MAIGNREECKKNRRAARRNRKGFKDRNASDEKMSKAWAEVLTHLFPGSKRLLEIAESVAEIKSICRCGAKATVNARFDDFGNIVYE